MIRTFALKTRDYLGQPEKKRYYNERLFTEVAPKYDLITWVLSLGSDWVWKRRLVELLPSYPAPVCVDLACGTGDLCRLLAGKYPAGRVVGVDLTASMLQIARRRCGLPNVQFMRGDMCELELADGSADVVTGGYALRNAPDLGQALGQVRRVLRPGGTAAFLDFSKPPAAAVQRLQYWLLRTWGGLWGLLLHGNHEVYAYIAESLRSFPDRRELRRCLGRRGLRLLHAERFFAGMLELVMVQSC